jgi:hypothetical protein
MGRYRRELQDQWDGASDEVKAVYGNNYADRKYKEILDATTSSHPVVTPVVDAMTTAVCHVTPRTKYLIGGSNQIIDQLVVSC